MLVILLYVLTAVVVVVIGLVAVGRETFNSAAVARPVVFDLHEAMQFVADGLSDGPAARLTLDDVKWILTIDIETLEHSTEHADDLALGREVLDEDQAIAAILERADASERDIRDSDIAAVLAGRTGYLEAIGAIGPRAEPE